MSAIKGEHGPPSKRSAPPTVLVQPTHIPGLLSLSTMRSLVNVLGIRPVLLLIRNMPHGKHIQNKLQPQNGLYSAGLPTQGQAALSQAGLRGHMHSLQPHTLDSYILQSNASHAPHQGVFSAFSGVSSSFTSVGVTNSLADPYQRRGHHQTQFTSAFPLSSQRQHNSFDPFLVSSKESESDNPPSTPTKASPPVHPSPKLASRTTGKLARRCQNDVFVPSTPVHSKSDSVQQQQPLIYDDGPRTAPLMNPRSGFSFNIKPTLTPMPERTALGLGGGGAGICVLVVSDDELDVRDDVVAASSEVAEDSTCEGLNHVGIALGSWGWACEKTFMIIWEVGICVLVVGNDKLNVGEDELNDVAASSEVAEDETCGKG
ncbi:hypothetical protein BC827DRAFT_1158099 [Russula dissimulans]|nr:hypothetical protein BC827DRAFT_1158099 [Russula dissimulans]